MHGFIVFCLAATALAAPQGYNYNLLQQQRPFAGTNQLSSLSQNVQNLVNGPSSASSNSAIFAQNPAHSSNFYGVPSSSMAHHQNQIHFGATQAYGKVQATKQNKKDSQNVEAIVSKRFYIHSAPEESDDDFQEKTITVGTPKKNYNVVFIKAPVNTGKKAALKINQAANEERTVIYVLSKKTDASDIEADIQELSTTTSKPEVFFIKYKTPEEAAHAQEQIQAQYDALGGSSQVSDEGFAPVTSVIGSIPEPNDTEDFEQQLPLNDGSSNISGTVPHSHDLGQLPNGPNNNGYLPPNYY